MYFKLSLSFSPLKAVAANILFWFSIPRGVYLPLFSAFSVFVHCLPLILSIFFLVLFYIFAIKFCLCVLRVFIIWPSQKSNPTLPWLLNTCSLFFHTFCSVHIHTSVIYCGISYRWWFYCYSTVHLPSHTGRSTFYKFFLFVLHKILL